MSDSKKPSADITILSVPEQTAADLDAANFSITDNAGATSPLEGLEDLLAPMSPELMGADGRAISISDDPITEMADDLVEQLVEEPLVTPSIFDTPVAATIAAKLATPPADLAEYSDQLAPVAEAEGASTPYSLLIEGFLKGHEREALLQILSRENLGIREIELEPQFEGGKILIPRVSEYVGVVIVQALRNAAVRMRLGPSERIYIAESADDEDHLFYHPPADSEIMITEEGEHPADRVILSSDAEIKGKAILEVIDTLHSSMNLKSTQITTAHSPKFHEAMERLKRQLKYQAHHRGANALLSFKYELHPFEGQAVYKLIVQANAVRIEN